MIRWHSHTFNDVELIEVDHDGGHTVLRVENDVDGETYYGVSGLPLSEDDLDELAEDRTRYAGSFFGPIQPRYRTESEGASA